MRTKRATGWVIWTANLDRRLSRREGRKVPKKLASPGVRLQELIEACSSLNLRFVAENKRYPRCWWIEGGRVIVEKSYSKPETLRKIAEKVKEIRMEREKMKESKGRLKGKKKW